MGSREVVPDGLGVSEVLTSLFAGLAGVAGTYAVVGSSKGFVIAPFAQLLVEYTPAIVFRYLRNALGESLQVATAVVMAGTFLGVGVLVAVGIARRIDYEWAAVPLSIVAVAALAVALTGTPLPAGAAGAVAGVVVALAEVGATLPDRPEPSAGRRRVLTGLATAAGVGVLGRTLGGSDEGGGKLEDGGGKAAAPVSVSEDEALDGIDVGQVESLLTEAKRKTLSVKGIEPLVSSNFYSVDINKVDPEVDEEKWSLSVTGEVDSERTYSYEDVRSMDHEHRFVTLRCVSDSPNGEAMDNALWTGIPTNEILDAAGPQGNYVLLHAADGYSVGFPLEAIRGGMLAFGMNGKPLPKAHGYPLRALVPGHWGETNVKWLEEIEVTQKEVDGYWESRGWEGTGPVHTVAKVWTANHLEGDRIQVGGHAYAGVRGISGVEVSTDGGETWNEAVLSEPLPGEDTWRQWAYEYESPGEGHEVVARAIEADGTVQTEKDTKAFPDGATGLSSTTVKG